MTAEQNLISLYKRTVVVYSALAPALTPLLAAPTEVGYHAVFADWAYQFAAIDPPASARDGKLDIIASQSGPSYGHAY